MHVLWQVQLPSLSGLSVALWRTVLSFADRDGYRLLVGVDKRGQPVSKEFSFLLMSSLKHMDVLYMPPLVELWWTTSKNIVFENITSVRCLYLEA